MILTRYVAGRALALCLSLTASGLLYAETITLQALEDFASIDAGEVPYYREDLRGTLAINAANEEYRDKFARATGTYSGAGGIYDLTLNTVGEEDGDCEYRILVNGVVVGTIVNDSTTADFEEQQHTVSDVTVPAGATLSVESNALSNGLIPENGGFAFARGRWRSLTLQNDDPVAAPVDVQVSTLLQQTTVQIGDSFALQIDVTNNSSTDTATQPVVTLDIPSSLNFTAPAQCSDAAGGGLHCALPELSPQQTQSINVTGTTATSGQVTMQATVSADQTDDNAANNSASAMLTVTEPAAPATVDLQLQVTASSGSTALAVGDVETYTLTITNAHSTNVATAPAAGVILPANLQFQSSADCTPAGSNVLCNLAELAPNAQTTLTFTATAVSAGDATLIASTSATESDDEVSDNEVVIAVTVVATSPASAPTETDSGGNSGGGSFSILLLPLLLHSLLRWLLRRRLSSALIRR